MSDLNVWNKIIQSIPTEKTEWWWWWIRLRIPTGEIQTGWLLSNPVNCLRHLSSGPHDFHNKIDFGEHNNLNFLLPSVFNPLMCILLCLWIYECNTFLLTSYVQHIHDTKLRTRLRKLLTSRLYFATQPTCCKICHGGLCYHGQILVLFHRRISSASQALSTISQAPLTTLPNHTQQPRHLLFL